MRHYLIVLALAGALTTSGCATMGGGGSNGTELVRQVQAIATTICNFVPTAGTITAIFTAGQFATAFAIAEAICAAMLPAIQSGKRRAGKPTVSGVVVRGYWAK